VDLAVLATPEAAPLAHPATPRKSNVDAVSNANVSLIQDADSVETEEMEVEAAAPPAAVRKLFPAPAVKTRRPSKTARAGLVLSVPRVLERLRRGRYALKVKETAAVYVAATLEYLVAEVLELAGNWYFKKKRVAPRHILLTLRHDKELEELTKGAIVPEGGVRPFVHPQLLPKGAGSDEGAPEEHAPTTSTVQSQVL